MKVKRERTEYNVQSVSNAISVLEVLSNSEHEQSVAELQEKLDLTKSNTTKILATLEELGYVEHNMYTDNFRLGVKTFQIAQAYMNKLKLNEVSLPIIKQVKKEINESTYTSILHKDNVVYISKAETDAPVKVRLQVGGVRASYATASGKIQLAYLDDSDLNSHLTDSFKMFTHNTVKNMDDLKKQLIEIKAQGYAIDDEEYFLEVRCVATPVINFMGNIIASISVCAPMERLPNERIKDEVLPVLKRASIALSEKYGGVVPEIDKTNLV